MCGTPPKWVKALYGGNAFAPIRAPLIEKRFDEESAGVAQDRDEHEDPHRHAGDQNPFLAKVDLQLIARRRLDSHGRQRCGPLGLPNVGDGSLDRPDTDGAPALR